MTAVLGWGWSQDKHWLADEVLNIGSPGAPALLLIWALCVFGSILIHELGHALTMRHFGQHAHIVLYHFGGLAINDTFSRWDGGRRRRTSPWQDLIISAAGPAAQLVLALGLVLLAYRMKLMPSFLTHWIDLPVVEFEQIRNIAGYSALDALIWINIMWAILNLAPILPLDGGQIMYNTLLLTNTHNAWLRSRYVSIVIAVLIGLYFMKTSGGANGLMFLLLAAGNWQEIQSGGLRY
jgi:stage IV sporulation protein FB